jgi:hypothetical protein
MSGSRDYFTAPVPVPQRKVKAASTDPLKNPQFQALHQHRETLRQTEELYHQQLHDFDQTEGAAIKPEHDPDTGRMIHPGPAQAHLQSLIDKSQGDPSTGLVAPEVRAAAKNVRLLQEKRQRLEDEAKRVSEARMSFDKDVYLPARNAFMGTTDGLETGAASAASPAPGPTQDWMASDPKGSPEFVDRVNRINRDRAPAPTPTPSAAPPGPKTGGGEPTPPPAATRPSVQDPEIESIGRMKQRRDEYQAQLDAGGDNLRQDVRDRLKGQVSLLNSKAQQRSMDQADAIHRQFIGHVTGQEGAGAPVDPKAAAAYFDQFKTLGQLYAEHQGAVIDDANKPHIAIPRWQDKPDDSTIAAAATGAIDGLDTVAEGLTSNSNVLILGSIGTIAKAAELGYAPARATMIAAQGLFTKQMAEGSYEAGKKAIADAKDPNASTRQTASDVTQALASAFLTAGSAHGLKNEIKGPQGPAAVDELPGQAPAPGSTPLPDQGPPTNAGTPTPPPAPRLPTDQAPARAEAVPVDEDLAPKISKLRQAATQAEAPPPAAAPVGEAPVLDHQLAGYDTRESFQKDFDEKGQHDVFETEEEYLKRVYCSQLGRGNFSIK